MERQLGQPEPAALGYRERTIGADAREHQRELLPTDPAHHIVGARLRVELFGDHSEGGVALRVPVGVVDRLEVVDVEHDHRNHAVLAAGALDLLRQPVVQAAMVGHASKGIVCRLMGQLLLGEDALDDTSDLSADLGHHAEQGVVGSDGRNGEELQNRPDLATREDGECEGSSDPEVRPREDRIGVPVGDPCRLAGGEHAARQAKSRGEPLLFGHAPKRRELICMLDVPDRGRHEVPRGRVVYQGVSYRPGSVCTDGVDGGLERFLLGRALVGGRDDRLEQHQLLLLVVEGPSRALRDLLDVTTREPFAREPLFERGDPRLLGSGPGGWGGWFQRVNSISSTH